MTALVLPVSSRDRIQGLDCAPISLVEYGDYQCPKCAAAHDIVQNLQQQFGEQLCFVFRHFPGNHLYPQAQHAAEAAEAAAKQGKFWQMHDYLFHHQHALGNGYLAEYADALGLDVMQFLRDMAAHIYADRVREDLASGIHSGVCQTPTFFINCLRYDGACDRQTLTATIEQQLEVNP